MKALVTGAAGFVGSHIVDALLARGDEVAVFDHRLGGKCLSEATLSRVARVEADIFDLATLQRAAQGSAAIFHCAAIVGVDAYGSQPVRTMETEEVGLRNVCATAREHGAFVAFASSSAVYGRAGGATPLDEDMAVAPVSNYGIAKRFNELYLAAQFAEFGVRSAALRIFNVYGPRQDERLVIPRFVRQARAGDEIVIFGDGRQTRDFVYVADVVAAALACADRGQGCEIVNVCSGVETSVLALAQAVVALSGSASAIALREPPAARSLFEVERCIGARRKLETLTGAPPPTPIEDGLARTLAAHGCEPAA